jgi:hypothetical protein
LTIQRLPDLVEKQDVEPVKLLVKEAIEAARFCRDWRNRRIAHRDLKIVLNQDAKPLEVASLEKVRNALTAIEKVLNWVAQRYTGGTIVFPPIPPTGAEALLRVIYDGLKEREQREMKIRQGDYSDLPLLDL